MEELTSAVACQHLLPRKGKATRTCLIAYMHECFIAYNKRRTDDPAGKLSAGSYVLPSLLTCLQWQGKAYSIGRFTVTSMTKEGTAAVKGMATE
eukprot:1154220-Pelagomonas_calceolata.AAC.1